MNANDSINPIAQTKPSYGNEWFEFGNHSKVNLSNHQTTKEQSKVITKQPISSARTFSLPSDATKTCQFLPDHRHFNVKSHVNHLAPITYTNVAPIKKGDSSFIQHNWYNAKYQDNVSNYYRQKLASSKVLFQNSKLKQLDMMDRLMLTQQQSNGKFETDESMRLFLVTTREGAPLFKVIEESDDLCGYVCRSSSEIRVLDNERKLLIRCCKDGRLLREHREPLRITIHPTDAVPSVLGHLVAKTADRYELFDVLFADKPIFSFSCDQVNCCFASEPQKEAAGQEAQSRHNNGWSSCCCCCHSVRQQRDRNQNVAFSVIRAAENMALPANRCNDRCAVHWTQLRVISHSLLHEPFSDSMNSNNRNWNSDLQNPLLIDASIISPSMHKPRVNRNLCSWLEQCFLCCAFRCSTLIRHNWTINACKLHFDQPIGRLSFLTSPSSEISATLATSHVRQVQFPVNLELRHKTLIMAASLYLNYVHFT